MGFWDDPDVKVTSEWAKFDEAGDAVKGTVSKLGKRVWPDGNVGVEVKFVEDDVPDLTANQILLKQALFHLKPEAGDVLSVTLGGIEKRAGGKTLKRFVVVLDRKDGESETVDQTSTNGGAPF